MRTSTLAIDVLNREEAERYDHQAAYALVGATNPDLPDPVYAGSSNCSRILRLKFDDIRYQCCATHLLFDQQHVDELVAFAKWLETSDVSRLVVHCEAGVSRSSAIALAFGKYLGADTSGILDPRQRRRPNLFVYWRLARALMPGREMAFVEEVLVWTAEHAATMGAAIDEHADA